MKIFVPPLKCQGIKTKLVPWIQQLVPANFDRWIEPFMGSGVVGLNINAKNALFADSNPHIIAFYAAIQSGVLTSAAVRTYLEFEGNLLRQADENGYQHYRFIRERFNTSFQPLDFLFLSRAGFNGMMRFSKAGKWNIPFCKKPDRFAPSYVTKITNQTEYCTKVIRPNWQFLHQDYLTTIRNAQAGDLIYCDPPYLGRYTDYYNNWTEDNERQLAQALRETSARFILSSWHHNDFRENTNIKKYWRDFHIVTRDHFYHSGAKIENRNPVVEALIFNFETHDNEPLNQIPSIQLSQVPLVQSPLFTNL
jgi:DNA adenine methylase